MWKIFFSLRRILLSNWFFTRRVLSLERNIAYFQRFTEPHIDLMRLPSKDAFKRHLKKAMFKELTQTWASMQVGRFTFALFPEWKPQFFSNLHVSRRSECYYVKSCFWQNDTRSFRHAISPTISATCAHCKEADETVEHIFLHCPHYKDARTALLSKTKATTLKGILSNASHAHHVQKFISNAILRRQDDDSEDL